jgi:hypothetical protein
MQYEPKGVVLKLHGKGKCPKCGKEVKMFGLWEDTKTGKKVGMCKECMNNLQKS